VTPRAGRGALVGGLFHAWPIIERDVGTFARDTNYRGDQAVPPRRLAPPTARFNAARPRARRVVRALLGTLAGIVFLRVLGVSLLFAGFVEHGHSLGGSTFQSGAAFAAYPLALALFMLPLSALSDRIGRRAVMVGALLVSSVGGIAAAFADDILLLTLARFVQGAGALNAVALAVAGEVGAPARRTQRMALLGAAAGIGFAAGILLGAYLTPLAGVPALLAGHSIASLALVPLVARFVPHAVAASAPRVRGLGLEARVMALAFAAFGVNLALTGLLFLSPLLIVGVRYELAITLMVIPGGLGMFLAARLADRGHARAVGTVGALLLGLAPLAFVVDVGLGALLAAGVLFFVGHSSLTALLPALAAERAAEGRRGTAQGVQSTLQYLGSAMGSLLVGALYPRAPALALVFVLAGVLVGASIAFATLREAQARQPA